MMELLQKWGKNPVNPKNVQIPFMAFIGMLEFLKKIDTNALTADEKSAYDFVRRAMEDKKGKIAARQAYAAIVHASGAENKQVAFVNYKATKTLYTKTYRG